MNCNETQNPPPKRPLYKKVFTFLKWLFVTFLAVLLVVGLIFQAPWKVLVLLAIFFFTLTIIPKRARKYIWLSFALTILILIVWIFLPEDNTGWRPYTIDDEIAEFNAKYAVPDEQNAVVIYNQLFKSHDGDKFVFPDLSQDVLKSEPNMQELFAIWEESKPKNTFYPDSWTRQLNNLTLTQPWSSQDYPELAQWLREKHGGTIEFLMQASEKSAYYFPFSGDILLFDKTSRHSAMRDWSSLLIRAANNDWADGRMEQATEKYIAALKTIELTTQQPGSAVINLLSLIYPLRSINSFILNAELPDQYLSQIETVLPNAVLDWNFYWVRDIDDERLSTKNSLIQMSYEVNQNGKTRFARGIANRQLQKRFNIEKPPSRISTIASKISAVLSWFCIPSHPDKILNIVDEVYENYYQDFDWTKEPVGFSFRSIRLNYHSVAQMLIWISEPAYYKMHNDSYPRVLAQKRTTQLIIALKQYKNKHSTWPRNLEQIRDSVDPEILIDPVNGDSFVYKLTNDSFMLYSKGKNNIDDAGVIDRETGADDILIWPEELPSTNPTGSKNEM